MNLIEDIHDLTQQVAKLNSINQIENFRINSIEFSLATVGHLKSVRFNYDNTCIPTLSFSNGSVKSCKQWSLNQDDERILLLVIHKIFFKNLQEKPFDFSLITE